MTPEQIAAMQEELTRAWAIVDQQRAHIDTLTAAARPCPWCGHPPMCHKGPEGECVEEPHDA